MLTSEKRDQSYEAISFFIGENGIILSSADSFRFVCKVNISKNGKSMANIKSKAILSYLHDYNSYRIGIDGIKKIVGYEESNTSFQEMSCKNGCLYVLNNGFEIMVTYIE